MNKQEFINSALVHEINEDRVKEISELYKVQLEEVIQKIISIADEVDFFDEERRMLSYDEIKSGSKLLGINVVEEGMIPLIDAYDCNYIVYLIRDGSWAKYTTVDKMMFKKRNTLEEIL